MKINFTLKLNLTNNCFTYSIIDIIKSFYCITLMRILSIRTINLSKATGTNFLNIIKLVILIILYKFFRNLFFNPFIPII
ncbi:hypothetical protein GLOIN_2v1688994 [Rhizophagus irregularis DAOM 181602=DAOM 197198]|uniref:Uncharacterized protein n=1 Tax=Rhizophagus irregularis (strain DAOM 181602 / DAOM 197198 / MUCL 43194) TaxID=747089 RepID=A0A2P4PCR5_RHIID|nr:hypothetical protein GLOIN_2v1688994 [Rhizophagus irregularis DAOM 181602=DAOM 197198]POG63181.1 hypothetical protein GLOIN_2v1688994 [Rhizophagus irregularis DAOM 181602=DAOM 197198]|eukprot:XP_025170047.1 hypothetical protein GLOIN_2v1688994 [Rhizophagus irregularis DAOM 181602=DAOM 197198]